MPSGSWSTTCRCARARLRWSAAAGQVMRNGLAVLGISAPGADVNAAATATASVRLRMSRPCHRPRHALARRARRGGARRRASRGVRRHAARPLHRHRARPGARRGGRVLPERSGNPVPVAGAGSAAGPRARTRPGRPGGARRAGQAALRLLQDPARRRGAEGARPSGRERRDAPAGQGRGPNARIGADKPRPCRRRERPRPRLRAPAAATREARRSASGCRPARSPPKRDAENLKARSRSPGWEAARAAGDAAGQGRALSRAAGPLRQHRRGRCASKASSPSAASTSR